MKIAILRIEGTNCEQESFDSFKRLGGKPEFVHLKQLLNIDCNKDEKRDVSRFDFKTLTPLLWHQFDPLGFVSIYQGFPFNADGCAVALRNGSPEFIPPLLVIFQVAFEFD